MLFLYIEHKYISNNMKNLTDRFLTESYSIVDLTEDECDCISRIMVESDFVKEMKRYNNDEVTKHCTSAIKKMEEAMGSEYLKNNGSILD